MEGVFSIVKLHSWAAHASWKSSAEISASVQQSAKVDARTTACQNSSRRDKELTLMPQSRAIVMMHVCKLAGILAKYDLGIEQLHRCICPAVDHTFCTIATFKRYRLEHHANASIDLQGDIQKVERTCTNMQPQNARATAPKT